MANWVSIQLQLENVEDRKRNIDLDIKAEVEVIYQPVMVDLDKIYQYSRLYNEAAEEVPGHCELVADNGDVLIAQIEFEKLTAKVQRK